MPGSVHDLALPNTKHPGEVVVDTNLVIARFLGPTLQNTSPQAAHNATWFFNQVALGTTVAFVPPTALEEFLHKLILGKFAADVPNFQQILRAKFPNKRNHNWRDLQKARPQLLRRYAQDLSAVVTQMVIFGLFMVQPWEINELVGTTWEDELVRRIKRYQTDVNDTHILLDAERMGISNVVTFDSDLRRARKDFVIYTWL
jgi:predicted nucleic acid-binding protein